MKKTFTALLSMLLCLAMVLSFAACGDTAPAADSNDVDTAATTTQAETEPTDAEDEPEETEEPSIVGTWSGTIDLSDMLTDTYASMGLNLEITSFTLGYTYTFEEDGAMSVVLDEDMFNTAMKGVLEQAADAMGVTYEAMLADTGMSEEEYLEAASEAYKGATDGMTYEFDGANLTFKAAEGESTMAAELTADTLTFESMGVELVLTKQ